MIVAPACGIVGVGGADAGAGIGLHPDLVAVAHGFAHRHGRHADAVFVILDFLRYADEHVSVLPEMVRNIPRNRSNEFSEEKPGAVQHWNFIRRYARNFA